MELFRLAGGLEFSIVEGRDDSGAANDMFRFGMRRGGVGPKGEVGGESMFRVVLDAAFLNFVSLCRLEGKDMAGEGL
jgi:hypothetical protein